MQHVLRTTLLTVFTLISYALTLYYLLAAGARVAPLPRPVSVVTALMMLLMAGICTTRLLETCRKAWGPHPVNGTAEKIFWQALAIGCFAFAVLSSCEAGLTFSLPTFAPLVWTGSAAIMGTLLIPLYVLAKPEENKTRTPIER